MKKYLLSFSFLFSFVFSQTKAIDSLKTAIQNIKTDSEKVMRLNDLAWELMNRNPDTSIVVGQTALTLSEKIHWEKGIAESAGNLGAFNGAKANYKKAFDYFMQALALHEKNGNVEKAAAMYTNVGLVYWAQGNYPKALECFLKASKIYESKKNTTEFPGLLGSIANVYNEQGDYANAQAYYEKALAMLGKNGSVGVRSRLLGNLGHVYNKTAKYQKALEYYFQALSLDESVGNKNGIARHLGNIGIIFKMLGDSAKAGGNISLALSDKYPKAENYFRKGLKISEEIGDKNGIASKTGNLGILYAAMKKEKDAEKFLLNGIDLSENIGMLEYLNEFENALSELYNGQSKFKEALQHYKKHITVRDSLFNAESTKKTIQSQMQYDFDKRSSADSIKNSEAKKFEEVKHQQEISKQKTFTYGGIIGFLAMIIVAGISYNAFRNKKKANIEIQHQKHLVEEKQKEILDSIYYARRIQRALITNEKYIERNLNKLSKKL